jgi:diguanylate cyclase (GGDEF)-like protein
MKSISLRSLVTLIGVVVALITAISVPAGYFASGYLNLSRHLEFKTDLNAGYLAKYIYSHDTLWQFQRVRIAELLSQTDGADTTFRKRVIDAANKVVLDEGDAPPAPTLIQRWPVTVAGSTVGHIELEATLRPLLQNTALVALFSALLGLGIFFALRIFPLRALDRTVGQLEHSNRDLAQTNGLFDAALNNMSHALCMFDAEGRLLVCNQRYIQMFKLSPELVKPGCTFPKLLKYLASPGHFSGDPAGYWAKLQVQMKEQKPISWINESGNGRAISVINSPMPNGGWVATLEDITEQRIAQAKISHMALHDALTNLPNRLFFREQMETRLSQLGRDQKCAVLCLDLDRFKTVNDTLGHPDGDKLLRQAAERMRKCLRDGDTLARLGGDEFAILQAHVSQAEDTSALAARLIEDIGAPFDLDGQQVIIGVSIGIAVAPGDAIQPDQLLKNADMALYRAKAEGKGTYRFFEPEMDRLMQTRRSLELDLRKAVVNGEFEIYYQPLINLQTEAISGFEALLRWNHPTRGLVAPLDFIPLAEETTLIIPIGEWVIRKACEEASKWPKEISIAINLSPAQFKMRNLSQLVMSALAHSGLAAGRLELEITESVLLVDNASTLEILHQLRSVGVRISMDDFGTGYSSLSYLRSFPFDKIKIDRSFVHDLQQNEESKAIVRAVSGLGISLGMAITGEGVETRDEVDYLRQEGCTEAQGYFFSKAKPASEIHKMLAERNTAVAAAA